LNPGRVVVEAVSWCFISMSVHDLTRSYILGKLDMVAT
jgi:hypothetical protein